MIPTSLSFRSIAPRTSSTAPRLRSAITAGADGDGVYVCTQTTYATLGPVSLATQMTCVKID